MNLNPPETPISEKIERHTLADKPRITKFNIDWDNTVNNIPSYSGYMFNNNDNNQDINNINQENNNGNYINNVTNTQEDVLNLFKNVNNNNKI
jgi:hypothetical protein